MTVWLVTGCSSGFGKEIVLAALKKGDIVIATCRGDTSRLSELEKAGAIALALDICASEQDVKNFVNRMLELTPVKANGGVDVLVNNAGYVTLGAVEEVSEEQLMQSFNTNFFGHVRLTRALLPSFRQRRSGTIAFIGSRVGFLGIPAIGAYTAAKYAVAGIAETLAVELESFNIRVTCIEPGDFRTSVYKGDNYKYASNMIKDYDDTPAGFNRTNYNDSFEQPGDPAVGAQRIVDFLRGDWPGADKDKKLPVRVALGDDVYESVKERYELRLRENEEWKDWICGVHYTDSIGYRSKFDPSPN